MSTATVIGKRKRHDGPKNVQSKKVAIQEPVKKTAAQKPQSTKPKAVSIPKDVQASAAEKAAPHVVTPGSQNIHLQIVTGSYERVLHGICATIPRSALSKSNEDSTSQNGASDNTVSFTDTFLFAAHASSIRCLAISPPTGPNKRTLATGSSDERIGLYSISTSAPPSSSRSKAPSLLAPSPAENTANRSLGSLLHHSRPITALAFPGKAKLFSAAEDNTLAITRTRDWTMLSSIRAPIPKPVGRPSGDTAAPGEVPAGVNAFAVHPSQKLMLSVGRGERCMRLWNLITGKKAGVLNFAREVLGQVGEGKWSSGEGRKVLWDEQGEVFVVGFERGAAVFGIDSKPWAVVKEGKGTKVQQMRFLPTISGVEGRILAMSTEDGRVLFFDLSDLSDEVDSAQLPQCPCVAQLGGGAAGVAGRIKDFEILQCPSSAPSEEARLLFVTASSDGAVRIWSVASEELRSGGASSPAQVGHMVGTLETANRITCLGAFLLDGKAVEEANGRVGVGAGEANGEGSGSEDEDEDLEKSDESG